MAKLKHTDHIIGAAVISGSLAITETLTVAGQINFSTTLATSADLAFTVTDRGVRSDTGDTADDKFIYLSGGGARGSDRGGGINLFGNEHATGTGRIDIQAGDVVGGVINLMTQGLNRLIVARDGSVTLSGTLSAGGITGTSFNQSAATSTEAFVARNTGGASGYVGISLGDDVNAVASTIRQFTSGHATKPRFTQIGGEATGGTTIFQNEGVERIRIAPTTGIVSISGPASLSSTLNVGGALTVIGWSFTPAGSTADLKSDHAAYAQLNFKLSNGTLVGAITNDSEGFGLMTRDGTTGIIITNTIAYINRIITQQAAGGGRHNFNNTSNRHWSIGNNGVDFNIKDESGGSDKLILGSNAGGELRITNAMGGVLEWTNYARFTVDGEGAKISTASGAAVVERVRIAPTGQFLVGTTSVGNTGANGIRVNGESQFDSHVRFGGPIGHAPLGESFSANHATAYSLFTLGSGEIYRVSVSYAGSYVSTCMVGRPHSAGGPVILETGGSGAVTWSVSGNDVQVTQGSGSTLTIKWVRLQLSAF